MTNTKRKSSTTDERYEHLRSLGRSSYVSKSGIEKLAASFKKDGIPEASSRATQYRARKKLCQTDTPYGKLVQQLELSCGTAKKTVALQHPLAMLWYVASTSQFYADLLRQRLAVKPCTADSPWNLIIYQDGVNPSDGLSTNHSRKSNVFYWSFLEFGMDALCKEQVWFPIALGRLSTLQTADGGITQLTLLVLLSFFVPHAIDVVGVALTLYGCGQAVRMFAKIGILLADEPAVKEMLACKGHAGLKPCLICMNGTLHQAGDGLHAHSDYAVSIACMDFEKFKMHTDASNHAAVRRVNETIGTADADAIQRVHGWGYNVYSPIAHERILLNVVSTLMWDWGHVYVCDGIADVEFGLFMQTMHKAKADTTYKELATYVDPFVVPKSLPDVKRLFDDAANRNNLRKGSFTSSASEFLTLFPILARYVLAVCLPRGQCMPAVMSLLAVLKVMHLLQGVKRGIVSAHVLGEAIMEHLRLFLLAYG